MKVIIFYSHIPYDSTEQELRETLQLAGPFKEFKLKTDPKTQQLKGFGFCEYADPDIAASALRNLKLAEIRGRVLNVDFASEHKSGTNLRMSEVLYRDRGEVVNQHGGACVDPAGGAATVEDVLNALTPDQEHMLLYAIREIHSAAEKGGTSEQLVEALAREADGALLEKLLEMYERVQTVAGGPQFMAQGGIYHATPSQPPTQYYYQPGQLHHNF